MIHFVIRGRDCGERISKSRVSEAGVYNVSPEYLAFKGEPEIFQATLKVQWPPGVNSIMCEFPEGGVESLYVLCALGSAEKQTRFA